MYSIADYYQTSPMRNQAFETQLSPWQELAFKQWATMNLHPLEQQQAFSGAGDYDYRGFYGNPSAQSGIDPYDKMIHYTDQYKKPSHQTFSSESMYAPFGNPGTFINYPMGGYDYLPPNGGLWPR